MFCCHLYLQARIVIDPSLSHNQTNLNRRFRYLHCHRKYLRAFRLLKSSE